MSYRSPRSGWGGWSVLVAFVLFAAYGLLRWQTMLPASQRGRLAVLLVLAALVTALGDGWELLARRSAALQRRWVRLALIGVVALVAAVAMLSVAGFPLGWTLHLRVAVIARALAHGIKQLPVINVPYKGHDREDRAVIVLAAGALMLAAALATGAHAGAVSTAKPPADKREAVFRRLALAGALLLVMAMLPSVLVQPRFVVLHGAVSFALLTALICGWRVRRQRVGAAALAVLVAVGGAVAISQVVHPRRGLVNAATLVSSFGPAAPVRFNWQQTYGPLGHSNDNTVVLRVRAQHPAYWKAEDLDLFDGTGWTLSPPSPGRANFQKRLRIVGVAPATRRRFSQTLKFSVASMRSSLVIAAGIAQPPVFSDALQVPLPGNTAGTWTLLSALKPGSRYSVRAYTPRPTPQDLSAAPARYPASLQHQDLSVTLPPLNDHRAGASVEFASYSGRPRLTPGLRLIQRYRQVHQPATGVVIPSEAVQNAIVREAAINDLPVKQAELHSSVLWPVYLLARRLTRGTSTPFGYLAAVDRYLHDGFTYVRNPPRLKNPIVAFLLQTKRGYCQQFAGAMALLLRMGGVPARVAVGFATGTYDPRKHSYTVTAGEAHAWVEAWFAGYGWVTFDPTKAAVSGTTFTAQQPGSSDGGLLTKGLASGGNGPAAAGLKAVHSAPRTRRSATRRRSGTDPQTVVLLGAFALLCLLGVLMGARWWRARRGFGSGPADRLLGELQAAFGSCGRPLRDGVTLAQLERFLRDRSPAAADYVRAVRLARFSAAAATPTVTQRRALRRWLGDGRGVRGRLRALLALPPSSLH